MGRLRRGRNLKAYMAMSALPLHMYMDIYWTDGPSCIYRIITGVQGLGAWALLLPASASMNMNLPLTIYNFTIFIYSVVVEPVLHVAVHVCPSQNPSPPRHACPVLH